MLNRPLWLTAIWLLACELFAYMPPAVAQQPEEKFYRAVRGDDGKVNFVNSSGEVLRPPSTSSAVPKELSSLDELPAERRMAFDSTLAKYQATLRRLEGARPGTFAPEELVRLQQRYQGHEERKNALANEFFEYGRGLRSGPRETLVDFHQWSRLYSEIVSAEFARESLSSPLLQAVQGDSPLVVLRGLAKMMNDTSKTPFLRMEQLRDLLPSDPEALTAQQATTILARWHIRNGDLARAELGAIESRIHVPEMAREYLRSRQLSGISGALRTYEAGHLSSEQIAIHKELTELTERLTSIAPGWGRLIKGYPHERQRAELRGIEPEHADPESTLK